LVIIWSYLFLYIAHGFVERNWSFPNLGNSVYAFVISLGTLLASQATNRTMGVKGAGELHPSLSDLVVHGGVLALDRVQQIVWTLVAAGMFLKVVISTYATATELPDIPAQLLTLMGLSSAGYLGGKLVRGPGPVIEQVTPVASSSLTLKIEGKHLSKDAFVWLDGVQQPKDKVTPTADDPNDPIKFAKELTVTLDLTIDDWNANAHAITVVNPDAQRADWRKLAGTTAGTAADTASVGGATIYTTTGTTTGTITGTTTGTAGDSTTGTTGDSTSGTTDDSTTGTTGDSTTGTTGDRTTGTTGDSTTGTTGDTTTGTTGDRTTGTMGDRTTGTTGDTTTGTTGDTDTTNG
jgi:hypothetical protein